MSHELVLPPLCPALVGRPYASVPLLAAHVRQHVGIDLVQRDLNRDVVRALISSIGATLPEPGTAGELETADAALLAAMLAAVAEPQPAAEIVAAVARDHALKPQLFETCGLPPEGARLTLADALAAAERGTSLGRLFRDVYRGSTSTLVGISVPFQSQLIPALELAKVLVADAPEPPFVVLGGPVMSLLGERDVRRLLAGSCVSAVVRHEGERAMARLVELDAFDPEQLRTVPGLEFRDERGTVAHVPSGGRVTLSETAAERFDPEYVRDAVELPVVVGRGCMYDCAFCDYVALYDHVNFRPISEIVDAVRRVEDEAGQVRFHFVYEVLTLPFVRKLTRALVESGVNTRWRGFQRVFGEMDAGDVDFLERSGCWRLDVGLEAADDEILDAMKKGYHCTEIESFFEAFAGTRIEFLVNIIVDYPGLTFERAMAAADFLDRVTAGVEVLHFELMRFSLSANSAIAQAPEAFSVSVVRDASGATSMASLTSLEYGAEIQMSELETRQVERRYRQMNAARRQGARDRAAARLDDADPSSRWLVVPNPFVFAPVDDRTTFVRDLHSGETFGVAAQHTSLLRSAGEWRGAHTLDELAELSADQPNALNVLASLGLLCPATNGTHPSITIGIGRDAGFYRGVSRARP